MMCTWAVKKKKWKNCQDGARSFKMERESGGKIENCIDMCMQQSNRA